MKHLSRFLGLAAILVSLSAQAATVDVAASQVNWTGKKVIGSHNGTVALKSGKIEVNGAEVTKAEFEADMTSIKVLDLTDAGSNAKLTGHLKSDDFFAVDKFPTASFKSTSVKALPAAAGKPTHEVTGDLTIKGVTKSITFPMTVVVDNNKATAAATLTVDRTLYDIRYGSGKFFQNLGDKMIDDTFKLDVKIVAGL